MKWFSADLRVVCRIGSGRGGGGDGDRSWIIVHDSVFSTTTEAVTFFSFFLSSPVSRRTREMVRLNQLRSSR